MAWDGLEYRAHSSEGGHTSFAPNDATELKLLAYLCVILTYTVLYGAAGYGLGLTYRGTKQL